MGTQVERSGRRRLIRAWWIGAIVAWGVGTGVHFAYHLVTGAPILPLIFHGVGFFAAGTLFVRCVPAFVGRRWQDAGWGLFALLSLGGLLVIIVSTVTTTRGLPLAIHIGEALLMAPAVALAGYCLAFMLRYQVQLHRESTGMDQHERSEPTPSA